MIDWQARAETAEERSRRLTEALSEIADAVGQVRGMDSDAVLLGTLLGVLEKARAALATTDEETT